MKSDASVIAILNDVLAGELTAINQYFLHARMADNWGYKRIAKKVMEESIDEMKHARDLTDRILFLEGTPNFQKLGKINIGETIPEQFESDKRLEEEAIARLRAGVAHTYEVGDHASRELLEHILIDEEQHLDWLETQLGVLKDIGTQNYLAEQLSE